MTKRERDATESSQTQKSYGSVYHGPEQKSSGKVAAHKIRSTVFDIKHFHSGKRHVPSILRLLFLAMAALVLWAFTGEGGTQNKRSTVLVAPTTTGISVYCSTFQDPAECEAQRNIQAKYWTIQEVRQQLWGTMEALAELELRENQHYAEQTKADKEENAMFDYFRKMMAGQVNLPIPHIHPHSELKLATGLGHPHSSAGDVRKPHSRIRCFVEPAAPGNAVSEGIHGHRDRQGMPKSYSSPSFHVSSLSNFPRFLFQVRTDLQNVSDTENEDRQRCVPGRDGRSRARQPSCARAPGSPGRLAEPPVRWRLE